MFILVLGKVQKFIKKSGICKFLGDFFFDLKPVYHGNPKILKTIHTHQLSSPFFKAYSPLDQFFGLKFAGIYHFEHFGIAECLHPVATDNFELPRNYPRHRYNW